MLNLVQHPGSGLSTEELEMDQSRDQKRSGHSWMPYGAAKRRGRSFAEQKKMDDRFGDYLVATCNAVGSWFGLRRRTWRRWG